MPLLQVRECPENIYRAITRVANKKHRSIAQQTVALLEKALISELSGVDRRKKILEKIVSRNAPKSAKTVNFVKFVREDRNR
ncbi:MAG: hypothetical protein LBL00_01670 [Endomicrobium sp.]|nr:hypothetical protein [Endomicrobium sp.]